MRLQTKRITPSLKTMAASIGARALRSIQHQLCSLVISTQPKADTQHHQCTDPTTNHRPQASIFLPVLLATHLLIIPSWAPLWSNHPFHSPALSPHCFLLSPFVSVAQLWMQDSNFSNMGVRARGRYSSSTWGTASKNCVQKNVWSFISAYFQMASVCNLCEHALEWPLNLLPLLELSIY